MRPMSAVQPAPSGRRSLDLKLAPVVLVGVEEGRDDDTVGKLATGEVLLGALTVTNRLKLYKDLRGRRSNNNEKIKK